MKKIVTKWLFLILSIVSTSAFSQNKISGNIYDTLEKVYVPNIEIRLIYSGWTKLLTTFTDSNGHFEFDSIANGKYAIHINDPFLSRYKDTSIYILVHFSNSELNLQFPLYCEYANVLQKCPDCNRKLVDIVYGDPSLRQMEMARKKRIYLGGCRVPVCHPQKYCYHNGKSY